MKVIIAGSRTITSYPIEDAIDRSGFEVTEIVSGEARGIDTLAKWYATEKKIPFKEFAADWTRLGVQAGPYRNRQMANYADALILIWDGESRGSASMLKEARQKKLPFHEELLMKSLTRQ